MSDMLSCIESTIWRKYQVILWILDLSTQSLTKQVLKKLYPSRIYPKRMSHYINYLVRKYRLWMKVKVSTRTRKHKRPFFLRSTHKFLFPSFFALILLYIEEVDEKDTGQRVDVPSLQLKIYERIPIPELPVSIWTLHCISIVSYFMLFSCFFSASHFRIIFWPFALAFVIMFPYDFSHELSIS